MRSSRKSNSRKIEAKVWTVLIHDFINGDWLYIEYVDECQSIVEGIVLTLKKGEATRFTLKKAMSAANQIQTAHEGAVIKLSHVWTKEEIPISAL